MRRWAVALLWLAAAAAQPAPAEDPLHARARQALSQLAGEIGVPGLEGARATLRLI